MTSELSGKVALVTGGASGIARATVLALLQAGATVAALDRDEAGVKAVVEQGRQSGGKALAIAFDLTDTKAIQGVVERVIRELGRIDILVNAAGVAGRFRSLLETEEQDWDFIHTVNLKAPMLLMKHVAQHMIARGGGGRIVNISSSSAFRARNSPIAYASSKAGIVQLTRSAAAELGRYDINVNAIDAAARRRGSPAEYRVQRPFGKPLPSRIAAGRRGGCNRVPLSSRQQTDYRASYSHQCGRGGLMRR
jgi:NAD(P)-dependent dehydrogenase (short-subunit alcohol dehydrogenase family)